jgi:hypothetical protein
MKFNNMVQRKAKTADPLRDQLEQKQDPLEIVNDLEALIHTTKRRSRRDEIDLADNFKQRVLYEFERDGRKFSKAWVAKMITSNMVRGSNIIEYTRRMKEIDGSFNQMKGKDCEMDIDELVSAVETSYNKNNECIAKLSGIEGETIELQGKINIERAKLVANLEKIAKLNNSKQTDEDTKLRINNLIKTTAHT